MPMTPERLAKKTAKRYVYEVGSMLTGKTGRPVQQFQTLDEALAWCVDHPTEQPRSGPGVRPWVARRDRNTPKSIFIAIGGRAQNPARGFKPEPEEIEKARAWEAARKAAGR